MRAWRVPALFNNDRTAVKLLKICEETGLARPFDSVYGACHTALSGGRNALLTGQLDEKTAERYFDTYAEYGVACFLTFSKWELTPADLTDPYANMFLRLAEKYHGGVILARDELLEYIRSEYPGIRTVASVIKPTFERDDCGDQAYYRDLGKRYDIVVPKPEFVKRPGNMQSISDMADRIEVLVNQSCLEDCKSARAHYLYYEKNPYGSPSRFVPPCLAEKQKLSSIGHTVNLPMKQVEALEQMGYSHFKLQGRNIYIDEFVDLLGMYLFDPTGVYQDIKRVLLTPDGREPFDISNIAFRN